MEPFPDPECEARPLQTNTNPPLKKCKRGEPEHLSDYLWWASRKKMKKAGVLYSSEYEDRVAFPSQYPIAWTTLRHLQCRELLFLLVTGNPLVPDDVQCDLEASIMYEIESVIEFILAHPKACRALGMGTSSLWVCLLFQQHLTLSKGKASVWSAHGSKEATAIGLEEVSTYLSSKVTGRVVGGGWRKLSTMEPLDITTELKKEATAFRVLLSKAKPDKRFCPMRKNRRDAPWLFEGIENLELPLHADDRGAVLQDGSSESITLPS